MGGRRDLIETLWNVKTCPRTASPAVGYGFNRDIVECKEHIKIVVYHLSIGFNRDIVECKASEMKDITDMLDEI